MPRVVTGSDFGRLVEQEFRRLRRYVPAPTIDQEQADDLVQDCLTRALAKQHLWQPDKDAGGQSSAARTTAQIRHRLPSSHPRPSDRVIGRSRRFTAAYSSQPDEAECFLFSERSTDGFASR
jgi:response regulator PhyR-like protein